MIGRSREGIGPRKDQREKFLAAGFLMTFFFLGGSGFLSGGGLFLGDRCLLLRSRLLIGGLYGDYLLCRIFLDVLLHNIIGCLLPCLGAQLVPARPSPMHFDEASHRSMHQAVASNVGN